MQYTVEARQLTTDSRDRRSDVVEPRQRTIEANDHDDALYRFVREERSELMSLTRAGDGEGESIATVRKEDTVFLVRVYAA